MADQPGRDDDDADAPVPPEVTVPPWLRTGPTPGAADPGAVAGEQESSPGAASEQVLPGRAASGAVSPSRITLGARRRERAPSQAVAPSQAGTPSRVEPPPSPAGRAPDELSTLSLDGPGPGASAGVPVGEGVGEGPGEAAGGPGDRRPPRTGPRIAVLVAAGAAVLGGSAVLGFVIARGAVTPVADGSPGCAEISEPGHVSGAGPGSLDSPAGAVLAFDHGYYVERSAEKAFEAVSPSSRMSVAQLRAEGVDRVPEGTTHCVDVRELSPTLLEVRLTEFPPDGEPVVIDQRVRVAENPDGTWGIVAITPAG